VLVLVTGSVAEASSPHTTHLEPPQKGGFFIGPAGASTRVTPTAASSVKNTAKAGISRSWAHPGGSYAQALPVAINLDCTA